MIVNDVAIIVSCAPWNGTKPDQRGGVALLPLGILEYPWGIVEVDYVADLPKSSTHGYTVVFIMACHLTKIAHFVPCHKKITTKEST